MHEDTVAFVTGASQGIGREIAITLAEYGASVALIARGDGIYETAEMIGDDDRTLPIETDITDEAQVEAAIEKTVETFGGLDCVVNNAGIAGPTAPIEDISVEEWQWTQDVNVLGTFLCTKHAVPHLKESDRGSVVAISSLSAKHAHPRRTPYTASKGAQITMMRAVAYELGKYDVTANTVCPGSIEGERVHRVWKAEAERTGKSFEEVRQQRYDRVPLGEIAGPRDVAEMVAFLAGPNARHVTAQDVNVGAGASVY